MGATQRNLITFNEAAAICRLNHRTLRRYVRDGRLPAYRVGGYQVRVDRRDVEKLIRPLATSSGRVPA